MEKIIVKSASINIKSNDHYRRTLLHCGSKNSMECLRVLCVFNVIFCVVHKEKYFDPQIFEEEEEKEESHSAHYLFLQEENFIREIVIPYRHFYIDPLSLFLSLSID